MIGLMIKLSILEISKTTRQYMVLNIFCYNGLMYGYCNISIILYNVILCKSIYVYIIFEILCNDFIRESCLQVLLISEIGQNSVDCPIRIHCQDHFDPHPATRLNSISIARIMQL